MTTTAVQTLDEVLAACPEWCDMDHAGVWDDDIQPTYHQTEVWLGPEDENQAQVTLTMEPELDRSAYRGLHEGPGSQRSSGSRRDSRRHRRSAR